MIPIPENLKAYPWYAKHQAWLRAERGSCRHDPGDAAPERAVLSRADLGGADLSRAVLRDADLSRAVLSGAVLSRAVLSRADLGGADLSRAVLRDAVLSGAVLRGADLSRADLSGAVLSRADLRSADLSGATGICSAGPVGAEGRIIYGVRHESGVMFQAGCFWGTAEEMRAAVEERYADGSGREGLRDEYLLAITFIEKRIK